MAVIETWLHQDLQEPVKVNHLDGNLFSNNGNGNRIGVVLTNNGEALASISGTVSGYVVTADGSTVPCTGSKSGNRASILIPAAAYQPGSIFITVFITDGTTVTTVAAVSSTVMRSRTNAQVDPGSVVTDWTQTINAAMQSVETAAENLGGIVAVPYASITFPVPLGKYTYHNNNLYRCITPIASSESFTSAHWTQVRLGDDVSDLKSAITNVETDIDYIEKGQKLIDILKYDNKVLSVGYSVNTTGLIGDTTNTRYFAHTYNYVDIHYYEKLIFRCDTATTQRIYYAFFTNELALIDSRVQIDVSQSEYVITIPSGAYYINVGGYGTSTSNAALAIQTIFYGGVASFYEGELDTTLTSAILPAQGKAVGDVITTTGVKKLRITPNSNDINFAVKTGLTNLYVGYGSGGYNGEDASGETEFEWDNGKYNTALGVQAFNKNETGDHCTAIGYTALKGNISGDFNTAVGEDALFSNTSGSNNIAIGDHAGQNNNGSDNILIGARVMRPATNANGNIIIGKEAGSALGTGGNNIIIGNSLNPASDSSNNLLIGDSSHTTVKIAGKTLHFNQDGTVTWD